MRVLSTREFVKNIKAGKVKPVLPMIAEKARATWFKLPKSEQMVRSLQDLMQDGILHTVTHVTKQFNPKNGAKFTTFLYAALDNFYTDIIREVYAEKRLAPGGVFSADTTMHSMPSGKDISIIDRVKLTRYTRVDQEMLMVNRIDAERQFLKAYTAASPKLRRYMIRWLLQPTPGRFKPGTDFTNAKREFRKVVSPILNEELCETIQKDCQCRDTIANTVARKFATNKRKTRSGFLNTEEFAVVGIISQETAYELIPTIG